MDKRYLAFSGVAVIFITLATTSVILYARGYRPDFDKKKIAGTGILALTSEPNGAQVYINAQLTTATNSTLNLPPGDYKITIKKDGYSSWEKKVRIDKEIVYQTDAILFPSVPSLSALTYSGALDPSLSFDGSKLAYGTASASAKNNGVWVFSLNDGAKVPVVSSDQKQIFRDSPGLELSKFYFYWSPDGKQILASDTKLTLEVISADSRQPTVYLLETDRFSEAPQNITFNYRLTLQQWLADPTFKRYESRIAKIPSVLREKIAQTAFLVFSPDEKKILYQSSLDTELPFLQEPRLLGINQTPEERKLKKGRFYIYDLKEDTNYPVKIAADPLDFSQLFKFWQKMENANPALTPSPTAVISPSAQNRVNFEIADYLIFTFHDKASLLPRWLASSRHLVFSKEGKIVVAEYDSTNETIIYSGPYRQDLFLPYPSGAKLVILTNLNQATGGEENLYSLGLR